MSAKQPSETPAGKTKKFGKGERSIPHPSQRAKKYYPAEDEVQQKKVCSVRSWSRSSVDMTVSQLLDGGEAPRSRSCTSSTFMTPATSFVGHNHHVPKANIPTQVRKSAKPAKPRESLQPGVILIILAGRFRGKRVILLKHLPQGVLLVTGPFKINGVPLRRVNARYVIATSMKVELKGIDSKTVEKVSEDGYFTADKKKEKAGEESFFKQGEKPEVSRSRMSPVHHLT